MNDNASTQVKKPVPPENLPEKPFPPSSVIVDPPEDAQVLAEPNDTLEQAIDSGLSSESPGTFNDSGFLGDNPNVTPPTDEVDLISFQLDAGDRATIDIDAQVLGSPLDSVLRLFDSEGNQVAVNDDSDGLDSFINFIASDTDTYFAGVSSFANFGYSPLEEGSGFDGFSTGDYNIEIEVGPVVDDLREPNDTLDEAFDSGLGPSGGRSFEASSFIGNNPNVTDTNDVDLISFDLNAGDRATIDIDARVIGSTLDSVLRVFDSEGNQLAVNDDSDGLDSFINFTAPESGTYYTGVSSFANFAYDPSTEGSGLDGFSIGDYDITLSYFPADADGDLQNGSFETGTFSSWRTIGDTSIETEEFGVTPTDGSFQALITNGFSDSGGSVVDSDLEQFLGITPGLLDNLGNGDVTEGSAIKQTFTANAGDILTFDYNFLTNEQTPEATFNDFAFFTLTPFTLELADTNEPIFVETLATGFNEETGYQTATIGISESGTFTLGVGVVDVGDDIVDSAIVVDNFSIGEVEDGAGVFYSTDRATDQVFKIDPDTGAATLVGSTGFDASFSGLSIDDGPLYASDIFDPSTFEWSLATIDQDTGLADIIGPQFDTDIHAIAHQDGTLYGFSIFQGLGTLNEDTGAFTPSFGSSTFPVEMRAADVDESTNTLFALGADNALYTIDVDSGVASFVGSTGVDFNFRMGLAYNPEDEQLYALGDDSGSGDNLYRIDKTSGAATLIGNTGLVEADSLEFVIPSGHEGGPSPSEGYDIDVIFVDDSFTPDQQEVFEDAASRWEEIITGNVPDVVVPGFGFVDDIAIDASALFIDGPGGILGQAGPTVVRSGSFLPARGIMQFDSADLEFLEDSGLFEDVILHEMAHVIGFGTIWDEKDLLIGAGSSDPRFVGEGATEEYNNIFGVSESGVPVEAEFGPGTALSHWDEDLFGNELMTGFINFGENPLSRITAASMGDLDYEVNVDAADPYAPPGIGIEPGDSAGRILAMNLEQTFVEPIAERG